MSRIIVKNLPKHTTEERLREFFKLKGKEDPTDVKLARNDKGISRQFGFIGYRTEKEAEEAIRYFNKSYLDTSRIVCEIAHKVGDPNIPRAWSRHSSNKDSNTVKSDKKVADGKSSKNAGLKKEKPKKSCDVDDPQLIEYLEAVQPRVKSKLWGNDSAIMLPHRDDNNKKKITEDSVPLSAESDEDDSTENGPSDNNQTLASNSVLTDMDYFKSKVKKKWSDSDSSDSDSDDDGNDGNSPSNENLKAREEVPNGELNDIEKDVSKPGSQNDPASEEEKEAIQTSRLFVRNLPYATTEEELEEHFGKIGTVSEVHLVKDKDKKSKGYAYIRYTHADFAARALEELDNSHFQGRLLHVMPAKEKPEKLEDSAIPKTFKQLREDKRKASEASGDTKALNPFFMRPDTVVESIAMKLGVSKAAFLNTEANDLAVRLALGETQVIKDTKESLRKAGVNVESLEEFSSNQSNSAKRSNHILLVKNLPHGTSNGELTEMFGKFGSLEKIILPPTKTLALVVFIEPGEARAAYKGLLYKRYKDAPLYIEWAPSNILSSKGKENSSALLEDVKMVKAVNNLELEAILEDADPDRVESRSLYVKNLNFKTTEESLKKHFVEHMKTGKISSAKIVMHKKHGKDVSKGYGFLEFDSMETAVTVCKDLQGTVLEGHAVILEPKSQMKVDKPVPKRSESDKSSTKLIVRNVPFQATEKDLRQLFGSFGQLKSVRLPVKMFGGHKGFAFVEFVTKQETQAAMQSLSSTHLYGRRLVLERANENETLEQLQARTAAQFVDEEHGFQNQAKLSRKRKNTEALDERKMKVR